MGVSPFELDERAAATKRHPVWLYWASVTDAVEPPRLVRVAGLI